MKHGFDMIYLAASLLNDKLPDEARVRSMDLAQIYELSCFHSIQTIVYLSLQKCMAAYGKDIVDAELYARWSVAYARQLKRLFRLEIEREKLTAFLEEKGTWYLCLKGAVLQNYYPQFGMRQMSDNDVLIDLTLAPDVRKYMASEGYRARGYGVGCHDVYQKNDLYFEIHRALMSDHNPPPIIQYYDNVKERLTTAESGNELRFTDEDFYVYFIAHAYKHFMGNGYGIRFLMDTYVLARELLSKCDTTYVQGELAALSLTEFETTVRTLSRKLFSDMEYSLVPLDESEREILLYCLSAGTFGSYKTHVDNTLHRMAGSKRISALTKLRYFWRRVFPPFKYYKDAHPVAYRFIITIPVLWGMRLIRGLSAPRNIKAELRSIKKAK